jgi:hypothetical protein
LGNKHNLSSVNTGVTYHAVDGSDPRHPERQVCIFCHTPHNAAPLASLWNRSDRTTVFGHYSSNSLVIKNSAGADYREPTGSSRLCLSCHDGVAAIRPSLGGLNTISISFGLNERITGSAAFTKEKIKQGHHPVSFKYTLAVLDTIRMQKEDSVSWNLPTLPEIKLDREQRMQCTTCHDPHQNKSSDDALYSDGRKIVPLWVYTKPGNDAIADHDDVCMNCHSYNNATIYPDPTGPWP